MAPSSQELEPPANPGRFNSNQPRDGTNENITRFKDDYSREISQHVEVPAYFIAEWVAENWWPLFWEPRKSEDDEPDPEFMSRHSLLAAQHGFALPKLLLLPIGRSMQLSAASRNVSLADVRFLNGALETLP